MPEVLFKVRWPDGRLETCYSPSRVIRDYYQVGRSYTLPEFLAASREGLHAASERVRSRYGGSGCSRAMAQLTSIERHVAAYSASNDNSAVKVEAFEE